VFCLLVVSQHFQYDLLVHGPKGLVYGLSKDFVCTGRVILIPVKRGYRINSPSSYSVLCTTIISSFPIFIRVRINI